MARTTEFEPNVIELAGGLNSQSARVLAGAGELIDCLNYEVTDIRGYTRMEGFSRFDGDTFDRREASDATYAVVLIGTLNTDKVEPGDTFEYVGGSSTLGEVIGISKRTDGDGKDLLWFVALDDVSAISGSFIDIGSDGARMQVDNVVFPRDHFRDIRTTKEKCVDNRMFVDVSNIVQQSYNAAREPVFPRVGSPSWDRSQLTPHGLFFYRDDLYAIIDHYVIEFENGRGGVGFYPNQIIESATSGIKMLVLDMDQTVEDWNGDAEGFLMVRFLDEDVNGPELIVGEALGLPGKGSQIADVKRFRDFPVGTAWGAGIYVAREVGSRQLGPKEPDPIKRWFPVDMGWYVEVSDVTDDIPVLFRGDPASDVLVPTATAWLGAHLTDHPNRSGSLDGGVTPSSVNPSVILRDANDDTLLSAPGLTQTGPLNNWVVLRGFGGSPQELGLPEDAIVTGVEVKVRYSSGTGVPDPDGRVPRILVNPWTGDPPRTVGSVGSQSFEVPADEALPVDVVLGSDSDLWGWSEDTTNRTPLTAKAMLEDGLGLSIQYSRSTLSFVYIHEVSIRVHYKAPISRLYAWNGDEDTEVLATNVHIYSGDTSDGTGVGRLYLYNPQPHDTGSRRTVYAGDEIRTEPAGAGVVVAVATGSLKPATLPTRKTMKEAGTQFRTVNANFYAVEDWDAVYGCSGTGFGWALDSYYFLEINTGDPTTDQPRHVAFHNNHLVFGFRTGIYRVSVVGEPTNFSGLDGAFESGVGDRITGLAALNGDTLGIFCSGSVHMLQGSVLDDFQQRVISPDNGCVEYSLATLSTPIFLDYRGVCTVEATDKYGDFTWGRLSDKVYPLIRNRVQGRAVQTLNPQNFYTSVAVRGKNQYRMFFEDGLILSMTLTEGFSPEFTTQKYIMVNSADFSKSGNSIEVGNGYVPLAVATGVNSSRRGRSRGRDRVFATFVGPYIDVVPENADDNVTDERAVEERLDHVFELDTSNYFDDSFIYSYFETSHNFFGDPFMEKAIQKVDTFMEWNGVTAYRVMAGTDFSPAKSRLTNDSIKSLGLVPVVRDGTGKPPQSEMSPVSIMTSFTQSGKSVSLFIENLPPTVYNNALGQGKLNPVATDGTPPFTFQALCIQFQPKKGER